LKKQLRSPFQAALLSLFFPGTGQIYNRQIKKAWLILILFLLLAVTVAGGILVWLYSIIDAWRTAQQINRKEKKIDLETGISGAIINSIIGGWGQIYNDELFKGFLMLLCFIFLFPITGIILAGLIATGLLPVFFILPLLPGSALLLLWLYGFIDSYCTARRINAGMYETPLIKNLTLYRIEDFKDISEKDFRKEKECVTRNTKDSLPETKEEIKNLINKENYREALKSAQRVSHVEREEDGELCCLLGKIHLYLENYGFSVMEFIRCLELNGGDEELYNNLGMALFYYGLNNSETSCMEQAEISLKKALEWGENRNTKINLINLLILKGELKEARKICNILKEQESELWQAKHCEALILMEEKERSKAKEILEEIIENNPSALEGEITLARLFEEEKAEGQAISVYKKILKKDLPEKVSKTVNKRIKTLNTYNRKFVRWLFRKN